MISFFYWDRRYWTITGTLAKNFLFLSFYLSVFLSFLFLSLSFSLSLSLPLSFFLSLCLSLFLFLLSLYMFYLSLIFTKAINVTFVIQGQECYLPWPDFCGKVLLIKFENFTLQLSDSNLLKKLVIIRCNSRLR